jgi:FtsZ-binding cell division protein ZapB
MTQASGSETDSLARLEDRVRQAAELVVRLRQERDAAITEREAAMKEAAEAPAQAADLSRELERLRGEVRVRVERLLSQLDAVDAG